MVWILAALGAALALCALAGGLLARFLARPRRTSLADARNTEEKGGTLCGWDALPREPFTVTLRDGYVLHGTKVPGGDRAVILSHGYSYNRLGGAKYVPVFRDLGYTVYLYDNRGHGENAPAPVTMGWRECRDLSQVIDYVKSDLGGEAVVGLHGESLGASLSVMLLGLRQDVAFLVADCGYADLTLLLRAKVKQLFHLPAWLVGPASLMNRLLYGYAFTQVRPLDALRSNRVPVCFIHGDADSFTDCSHSRMMFAADSSPKELHLLPGSDHARCRADAPDAYARIVREFLARFVP